MIGLAGLVPPEGVLLDIAVEDKDGALRAVAETASRLHGLPVEIVLALLREREKLGTTGLGQGVAVPHAKLQGLAATTGIFCRITPPVDFAAVDGEPVDLILAVLTPEQGPSDHPKVLAKVARTLRDRDLCDRLRAVQDQAAVLALLSDGPENSSA